MAPPPPSPALLLRLAVAAALALHGALACDLPVGTCACSSSGCRNSVLGWARIQPNTQGLGTFFEFGIGVNYSDPTKIASGQRLGNRNYEYVFVNSTPPFGSGMPGRSITENLVDPAYLDPNAPPLAAVNNPDLCCALCASTPTCNFYAFYPLDPVLLIGLYAQKGGVPLRAPGLLADFYQFPFYFLTEPLLALPDGIATQCVLLTKRNHNGLTFRPNQYAFDGDKQAQLGAANPKVIIGGTCNSNPSTNPCP